MPAARILVLDSGVGGLSIVSQIRALCPPSLGIDYLADWAAFPYGPKTEAQLTERLLQLVSTANTHLKPDIVVIACNTASTLVLNSLRKAFKPPFIGVVPAVKPAAHLTQTGVIGVLATQGTVQRPYTTQLIKEFAAHRQVHLYGSHPMVMLAERKLTGEVIHLDELTHELNPFIRLYPSMDTLVLACTHFPLLLPELIQAFPQILYWVDSGAAIARRVNHWLNELNLNDSCNQNTIENRFFYTLAPSNQYNDALLSDLLGVHSQHFFETT
jgi:glutamate racemase